MPKAIKGKKSRISDGPRRRKGVTQPINPTDTPLKASLAYKPRTKAFRLSVKTTRPLKSGHKLYHCDSVSSCDQQWCRGDIGCVDVGSITPGYVLILDILQEWMGEDVGSVGDTFFIIAWFYDKSSIDDEVPGDKNLVLSSHVQVMYDAFTGPPLTAKERELDVVISHIFDFQMRAPAKLRRIHNECVVAEALEHWKKTTTECLEQVCEQEEEEKDGSTQDMEEMVSSEQFGEEKERSEKMEEENENSEQFEEVREGSDSDVESGNEKTEEVHGYANGDKVSTFPSPLRLITPDSIDDGGVPAELSTPAALSRINEVIASSHRSIFNLFKTRNG